MFAFIAICKWTFTIIFLIAFLEPLNIMRTVILPITIVIISLLLIACDGGVNAISIALDGKTTFNPPLKKTKDYEPTKPSVTNPNPKPSTPVTPAPKPDNSNNNNQGATTPVLPNQPNSNTSIMENLPALSSTIKLTERESLGMPKVNGESIEGDVYGNSKLIVKYSKNLTKIRYAQSDINALNAKDSVGKVEGSNGLVPFPVAFVKLFFNDENGDATNKIFGIITQQIVAQQVDNSQSLGQKQSGQIIPPAK